MTKGKKIWNVLYKIGVTAAYLACILILCVQALTPGNESSDISNNVGGVIDNVVTEIQKPDADYVAVSGLDVTGVTVAGQTLSTDSLTMLAGEKGKIQCAVSPENATNKSLLYASSNADVAEALADGTIRTVKQGETIITVTSEENGSLTKTFSLTVREIAVTGIAIKVGKTTVYAGDSLSLEVDYSPANTTEKGLIWTSSNTDVLTVNKDTGKVKGVAVGTATVTATSKINDSFTDSIEITVEAKPVTPPVLVTKIELTHSGVGYIGSSEKIACAVSPSNATNKGVGWSSSDESIATVSQSGKVTYLKAGAVTITARSSAAETSDLEASVSITVKEVLSKTIALEIKDLTKTESGYSLKIKHSGSVLATLEENATVLDVEFSSSNPDIAKISQDGTIEGVSLGKVTITVSTSYDGETTTESFELTVVPIPFSEQFDNFALWVRKGFGHFGAFLVLGICAALTYHTWFSKSTKGKALAFIVCLIAGFAVAGITEIFQLPYFTQGRYCSFDDVMLDFRGYCCSSVLIFAWSILVNLIRALFKNNGKLC